MHTWTGVSGEQGAATSQRVHEGLPLLEESSFSPHFGIRGLERIGVYGMYINFPLLPRVLGSESKPQS